MPVHFPPPYVGGYGRGSWKEREELMFSRVHSFALFVFFCGYCNCRF